MAQLDLRWGCVAVLAMLGLGCMTAPDLTRPFLRVFDQQPFHGTVVVQEAVSLSAGWIAIHTQDGGAESPPVIGRAAVKPGLNRWVRIPIYGPQMTDILYATLHVDGGLQGTWEFPGPDAPVVTAGGNAVTSRFRSHRPIPLGMPGKD